MHAARLRDALQRMAAMPGVLGCAVVDLDAAMAWQAVGVLPQLEALCEGAADYWRMADRRSGEFAGLGGLRAQVLIHASGRLTLVNCGARLLLVCVSAEPDRVDWTQWQPRVQALKELVASF
jgi:predicted regulator of Ras-like GTPase activity (Roadblock/LC7/MglB family)